MDFKVCVRCFTFNHSKYITETMDGFVMQQTNFPYICCIVDDASTDGEQVVIVKYLNDYFDIKGLDSYEEETEYAKIYFARHKNNINCFFAVLLLKENHYSNPYLKANRIGYLSKWRSNIAYEALCEGDDYWIDNRKLQIQVDFLDANDKYAMCYTKCKRYHSADNYFESKEWGGASETFEDFLRENTVPTLTVMFRIKAHKKYYDVINPISHQWKMGDFPMWLYLSHEYGVKFLDCVSGVYRITDESASHFTSADKYCSFIESSISIVDYFLTLFNYDIDKEAYKRQRTSRLATNLAFLYNDLPRARRVILSLDKKNISDYLKLFLFSNKCTMNLYKRFLKR